MVRFQRVADAFEVVAKGRDCGDSSGSEHSPEKMMDLSDLVNSFIEKGNGVVDREIIRDNIDDSFDAIFDEDDDHDSYAEEMIRSLERLFGNGGDNDDLRRKVTVEAKKAWRRVIGDGSSPPPGFKRRLMARLREQGLDAGICKSKWEKNGKLPSGDYEYIDVNVSGTRYIINVSLAGEFEIARPTENYATLLEVFPLVSVCRVDELKQIVKLMCRAIKKSMSQMKMHVPPWRRHAYVQAKWFGPYKRTTNELPSKGVAEQDVGSKRTVGFVSLPGRNCYRQKDVGRGNFGLRIGNLAVAMNGAG